MQSSKEARQSPLSGRKKEIPLFKVFMPESVMEPLRQALMCGYVGEGPRVELFERHLSPWVGTEHVLAVNNGTAAIQLALRLSGVAPGDEVISTPMTCVATNTPILAMGARIVWADIDPWTGTIDPADVRKKITSRTRAIMCVHWGGYPCDLDALHAIAADHGIRLIEDACHALGSTYRGKPVGGHSDFACFSFQAIKMITTVDGGALACRSPVDRERGRLLRWYGIDRTSTCTDIRCKEDIEEFGYKFHMNDVTAAIGLEQLTYLDDNLKKHREHARRYNEAFGGLADVRPLRYLSDRSSAYWLYTIRAKSRDRFIAHLAQAGITASQVHSRNDRHRAFRDFRVSLPGVDEFVAEQVSIPVGWWLTGDEINHIINIVSSWAG